MLPVCEQATFLTQRVGILQIMKRVGIFMWGVGILLGSVWFIPQVASAAALYIDPGISELNRGDSVTMSVRLDTDEVAGECVNAVDAIITYSENINPVDVSIGDSIFRVWVESPTIDRENRTITFAGGIPNGYCGRVVGDPRLTNVLARIVFQSPGFSVGGGGTTATIGFAAETTAYLNDGFGTKADLATYPATIELNARPGATLQNSWDDEVKSDRIPPEEFTLDDPVKNANDKYYITFSTTDKQTGVDHYEVMEEPLSHFGTFQWGRADAPWIRVVEPENIQYVLRDQSLNSIIYVKAVDKAGNEYIAKLIPDENMRTLSGNQLLLLIAGFAAGLLLIVSIVITVIWLRRRRQRKDQPRAEVDQTIMEE